MYDAHCHLSTDVKALPDVETRVICNLMSTNQFDLDYVYKLGGTVPNVNPCFGIHPWYCHMFTLDGDISKEDHYKEIIQGIDMELIQVLPDPILVSDYLSKIESYIRTSKDTAMIGEIGLDKMFKIPRTGFYGDYHFTKVAAPGDDSKKLTPYYVSIKHQQDILHLFLQLSIKYKRPVSLHCVRVHGSLLDIVKKTHHGTGIPIALHSYSGSVDHAKNWVKVFGKLVFFSISKVFNIDNSKYQSLIEVIPLDNLLIETDLGIDNYSHERHVNDLTDVVDSLCEIKKIPKQQMLSALQHNWNRFIYP